MASVVTFAQLPEEEPAFLAYVQKSGDVWARALRDDPHNPEHQPLPVVDFLQRYAALIVEYQAVSVYLGLRADVLQPVLGSFEVIEGGTPAPFVQSGRVVPGVHTIEGGTAVRRPCIDFMASSLVRYDRGEFGGESELRQSNLCYYSGCFQGQQYVQKPPGFLKWARKVLDWVRRHTPERVPVHGCNYASRATKRVAEACRGGLKVSY
jgi:hypothetical protein